MGLGAGQIVDEDDFAAVQGSSSERPVGRLVASGTQALADNTDVTLTWTTEEFDTHGFHSTVTDPSRVTPNVPGYYRFYASGFFAAQATPNFVEVKIKINGTAIAPAVRAPGMTTTHGYGCTVLQPMNGTTDYAEVQVKQDSAGADDTAQSIQFSSVFEWEKVRDL